MTRFEQITASAEALADRIVLSPHINDCHFCVRYSDGECVENCADGVLAWLNQTVEEGEG